MEEDYSTILKLHLSIFVALSLSCDLSKCFYLVIQIFPIPFHLFSGCSTFNPFSWGLDACYVYSISLRWDRNARGDWSRRINFPLAGMSFPLDTWPFLIKSLGIYLKNNDILPSNCQSHKGKFLRSLIFENIVGLLKVKL